MRTFARLHLLGAFAVFTLVFVLYSASSSRLTTQIHKTFSSQARRLVVFGDFHSDTATYAVNKPKKGYTYERHEAQGLPWTALLADEVRHGAFLAPQKFRANPTQLLCDGVNNFARSYPTTHTGVQAAAMVDNGLVVNMTNLNTSKPIWTPLSDFRDQVKEWAEFEQKRRSKTSQDQENEWTLFSVFFGTWDLWQIIDMAEEDAEYTVQEAVLYLFDQLDVISAHSHTPPTILLSTMFDLTFTPRFQYERIEHPEKPSIIDLQRKTISLVQLWNEFLRLEAADWPYGNLIVLDMDKWLVNELRQVQLYDLHYQESDSLSSSLFEDASSPCYTPDKIKLNEEGICENPAEYFFW